jgi:hypothetical protein
MLLEGRVWGYGEKSLPQVLVILNMLGLTPPPPTLGFSHAYDLIALIKRPL